MYANEEREREESDRKAYRQTGRQIERQRHA